MSMPGLMMPPSMNQFHFGHNNFFSPSTQTLLDDQIPNGGSNFLINRDYANDFSLTARGGFRELPKPPVITNRRKFNS
nr:axial regulator YABBY 5-like [Tanacetum cinerariifolium]